MKASYIEPVDGKRDWQFFWITAYIFEEIFLQVDNTSAIGPKLEKLKNERISMIDHVSKAARLIADIQHGHSS